MCVCENVYSLFLNQEILVDTKTIFSIGFVYKRSDYWHYLLLPI